MKAIVVKAPGGVEQLEYGDWPDPQLNAGEVLVRVRAAALNYADIWLRNGLLGPLPMIPGIDAAGEVVEVAADVSQVKIGTRVLLNPATSCDACEYCYSGEHGLCPQRKAIGQLLNGSFAQYVKIPWRNVHAVRDDLGFEEAAAIPSAFFTAWQMLTMRAQVAAGQTVLVMAGTSGVGSAAIQIARLLGARVIATCGSEPKLARARELGADEVVDHSDPDWASRVREVTGGQGVHVIVDTLGAAMWEGYTQCARVGGRIVTCSFITGREAGINIETMMRKQLSITGTGSQGSKLGARRVVQLVNERRLRGVIDSVFALQDAPEAQRRMEDREVMGKIILVPEH